MTTKTGNGVNPRWLGHKMCDYSLTGSFTRAVIIRHQQNESLSLNYRRYLRDFHSFIQCSLPFWDTNQNVVWKSWDRISTAFWIDEIDCHHGFFQSSSSAVQSFLDVSECEGWWHVNTHGCGHTPIVYVVEASNQNFQQLFFAVILEKSIGWK